jgi:DHA1 family bicyclomycin/chloramphenicol resistance-like MFS transporter
MWISQTFQPFRPSHRQRPSFAALVLVAGIGPMALDTYMPVMPQMRASLHTGAALIQLTVTGYIVGMALGQLLAGPVSDGVGRRPVLLVPAFVFTAAAIVCATAVNADVLVVTRLVHGIAAGATVACGRAVVSDCYRGGDLAIRFGTLMAITSVGPVIAPQLGSVTLAIGTWRTIFWGMALLGVIMTGWIAAGVPESLPAHMRHGTDLISTGRRMLDLIRDWDFSKHVVVLCLAVFGFFTYIGGASFVLQTVYRVSPSKFAFVFSVNAGVMVAGIIAYRLAVARYGSGRVRAIGVTAATGAAFGLLAVAILGPSSAPGITVPWLLLAVVTGSMGLVLPATTTLAQQAGDRARGTASSLQGGLGMLAGALATPLTGVVGYASLLPMAVLMAAGFGAAALTLVAVSRPGRDRRPGPRLPEASTARGAAGSHLARWPAADDMPAGCGQSAGSLDR